METPSDTITRKLAARLAPSIDPNLPAYVERALGEGGAGDEPPTRLPDTSQVQAFASFVLALGVAAWGIFKDVRDRREKLEQAARDAEKADKIEALQRDVAFLKGMIVGRLGSEVETPRAMPERVRVAAFEAAAEEAIEEGKRREGKS